MILNAFRKYRFGLVLSGGGARGLAHLGVLKALNEAGIYPDVLSGSSAGALAAVLYSDGHKPDEILKMFTNKKIVDFVNITLPKRGLLKITGLENLLRTNLKAKTFEELKIPVYVSATNYNTGYIEYFNSGTLIDKLIASASIPILFNPTLIGKYVYMDGGILDNLPFSPVYKQCKKLVGSHCNPISYEESSIGLIKIAERTFNLSAATNVYKNVKHFNLFIEPHALKNYALLDLSKGHEIFELGYHETKRMLNRKKPFIRL